MFEKVLLPTDFSADSQKVLGYVKDIPGVREVILLHVVDATRQSVKGWTHGPAIENAKILLEENRQVLEKNGVKADVAIETIVNTILQGDIPLTILEKAGSENVSLIAMGARGKNTIQEILLGSVSASVTHHATCPVLLMRFMPEITRSIASIAIPPLGFRSRPVFLMQGFAGIVTPSSGRVPIREDTRSARWWRHMRAELPLNGSAFITCRTMSFSTIRNM